VSEILNYIVEAKDLLCIGKNNYALNAVRKALEAICNDTIKREEIKIEAKKPPLEYKINEIKRKIDADSLKMPKDLYFAMTFLQDLGNHGSHHQEGETKPISHDSVETAISRIKAISEWYINYYEIKIPNKRSVASQNPETNPKLKTRKKTKVEDLLIKLTERDKKLAIEAVSLFEDLKKLKIKFEPGTSKLTSISVKSPKPYEFLNKKTQEMDSRPFNFGNFRGNGEFRNFSCEGKLGKEYLLKLSNMIPGSKIFEHHSTEFRNSVVDEFGESLKIQDILNVKNSWIELIQEFKAKINF
jgi:hypothetical protein